MIEFQSLNWIRFTFTGTVTGGELKTEEKADSESLQAQWIPSKQLSSKEWCRHLRSHDILPLIEKTLQWNSKDKKEKTTVLPSLVPFTHTLVRTILIEKYKTDNDSRFRVFVGHHSSPSVPLACVNRIDNLHSACATVLQNSGYKGGFQIVGICCVEHMGHCSHPPMDCDGVCFTLLLSPVPSQPVKAETHCWMDVDDTLTHQLIQRLMLPDGSISCVCF
jgi:8-oxo-dGDP phosphatase